MSWLTVEKVAGAVWFRAVLGGVPVTPTVASSLRDLGRLVAVPSLITVVTVAATCAFVATSTTTLASLIGCGHCYNDGCCKYYWAKGWFR